MKPPIVRIIPAMITHIFSANAAAEDPNNKNNSPCI